MEFDEFKDLWNQYVPLFLCKEDLGIAVQSAYKQRNATQIKLYRDKAKKHEDDFNQVGTSFLPWAPTLLCVGVMAWRAWVFFLSQAWQSVIWTSCVRLTWIPVADWYLIFVPGAANSRRH
eukprot:scaffold63965_cov16-Tisochrysis_lutea.AAC.4